jgi:hypothetical protein
VTGYRNDHRFAGKLGEVRLGRRIQDKACR